MTEQKLVTCVMGDKCSKYLEMCFNSIKDSDKIIFCWGMEDKATLEKAKELFDTQDLYHGEIIQNPYNQEDKAANGRQRNFYLSYLKENFPEWYCLVLDADECVEDLSKIKEFIQYAVPDLYSVKMRHFHQDLGHEDSTQVEHFAPNRLFKISEAGYYPEVEHPVLTGEHSFAYRGTTIWHLAHIEHCFSIKKRYERNLKMSNMHTREFLDNWYKAHIFGQYPNKPVNLEEIPEIILREFLINKDEIYFNNRGLEPKHFLLTKQWADYFHLSGPGSSGQKVIEYGCGKAPFGVGFINQDVEYMGVELSKYAVEHAFIPINQGDITKDKPLEKKNLCLVFDVLEHLSYEDLDLALENIKDCAENFIISVPVKGDSNLLADKTHKIKETKEWWLNKIKSYGFIINDTPDWWLFKDQIIVASRGNIT